MNNAFLKQGLKTGTYASLSSTLALALAGKLEHDSYTAPINAISHWIWGDSAFEHDEADIAHTVVGFGIHHVCSIFWAIIYEYSVCQRPDKGGKHPLRDAAVVAALAALVDYNLTPHRLRPGFEQRLNRKHLLVVYSAFALGMAWQKLRHLPEQQRGDSKP